MQLLSRNTYLCAETELETVGKTRAGVDVNAGAVDFCGKIIGSLFVFCQYSVAVAGAVSVDSFDRFDHAVDDIYGQHLVAVFFIVFVLVSRLNIVAVRARLSASVYYAAVIF